jgi:hypothetical protein
LKLVGSSELSGSTPAFQSHHQKPLDHDQYDEINRAITWQTLSADLPEWKASLTSLFQAADAAIEADSDDDIGSR